MISPAEIVKKSERKYRAVLRAWLSNEAIFPLTFGVGSLPTQLAGRRKQIETLRAQSRDEKGVGYQIEWVEIKRRNLGLQTEPKRIVINSLADYLAVVRKKTEFGQFSADVAHIRRRLPMLEQWLRENPHHVITHAGQWENLITVCRHFQDNPNPQLYVRELPIAVHTKFIENHRRILRMLLDALGIDGVDSADFHTRFGLKTKPPLVRIRLLDDQMEWQYGIRLDDLSLPVPQLAHLLRDHIRPRYVIIVENLINFLTLPRFPDTIGLLGGGFAIHLLRDVKWLHECDVIYWGDVDAQGLQILSDLRGLFPQTRSVMMDAQTVTEHKAYIGSGNPHQVGALPNLLPNEAAVAKQMIADNLRLEQEHIPHEYALSALRACVFASR